MCYRSLCCGFLRADLFNFSFSWSHLLPLSWGLLNCAGELYGILWPPFPCPSAFPGLKIWGAFLCLFLLGSTGVLKVAKVATTSYLVVPTNICFGGYLCFSHLSSFLRTFLFLFLPLYFFILFSSYLCLCSFHCRFSLCFYFPFFWTCYFYLFCPSPFFFLCFSLFSSNTRGSGLTWCEGFYFNEGLYIHV